MKRMPRSLPSGPWLLKDLLAGKIGLPNNGLKVFTCFHCGGGSSMGYRLAGFDVVGGCEIDKQMMKIYRHNMPSSRPELSFEMPIQIFKSLAEWPSELDEIDVLDGSPPCSSFSMAGSREDSWGEKKRFREGQENQVLDDLFFHFIEVAARMRPKMVVAENVKGLIVGNARGYVRDIFDRLNEAGYDCQLFLLNAAKMGVPQARERTFFLARRRDLGLPKLSFDLNEKTITASRAFKGLKDDGTGKRLTELGERHWRRTTPGASFAKAAYGSWFNWKRLHPDKPSKTMPAICRHTHWSEPRFITFSEAKRLQSFPDDYDFLDADGRYVCGMSVPPLMMARVASEVARTLSIRR